MQNLVLVVTVALVQRVFRSANADVDLIRLGERSRRPHEVDTLFGDHSKAIGLWGVIAQPSLERTVQVILDEHRSCLGVVA